MERPDLIALLVCDAIAMDPGGKVTLYGIFDRIWAATCPARHPQFVVYAKCRFSAPGEAKVVIEAPDGRNLVATEPMRPSEPGTAQAIYGFTAFEFPVFGDYRVRLVSGGQPEETIGHTTIEVRTKES